MPSEHKLLKNLPALMNIVRRIAIEAGEITLRYYDDIDSANVDAKADGSPVSLADQEAEALICGKLKDLVPGIPIVGEELIAAGERPDLSGSNYFWLVDALDGTKEFITGGEDFTVNIALIHEGEPVLGVVYVPVSEDMYAGYVAADGDRRAIRLTTDRKDDKEITVRPMPKDGLTVMASASHGSAEKRDAFLERFKVKKLMKRGSSLKICVIAEGKADLYPRFGPTCEWDTAAGHAVLRAAGGVLTDTDGVPLKYGGLREKYLNPEFIASAFVWSGVED